MQMYPNGVQGFSARPLSGLKLVTAPLFLWGGGVALPPPLGTEGVGLPHLSRPNPGKGTAV